MAYFCRKGDWVLYFNIHTLSLIVSLAFWEKTFFFRNVKYESSSYTIAATQNDWVALKLYYPDSRINVRAHFFLCPRYSTMESFACGLGTREKLIWVQDKVANDGFFTCATRQAIQGCAKKSNPLGKILYLWNYRRFFFTKFTAFTDEDSGHISCKFY